MSNKNFVKSVINSSEENSIDIELPEQPSKSKEEQFHDLKRNNETVVALNFDEEDCEYLVIAKDKNIKLPQHFLKYFCENLTLLPKEIDLSRVKGEDIIQALSFYLPRSKFGVYNNFIVVSN